MAKLLYESSFQVESLTENTPLGKQLYIEGIFAQAEVKNGNGRIYPKSVMEKAVAQYNENYVSKRRALGELNHPARPFADPAEAAILIESFEMDGNNVIGKAKVLNTPKGQIIKGLLEGGFNLGVSTRGLGSLLEKNGAKVVQSDFMMTATDAVDMPSGPDCYVNSLYESTWINKNGVWVPVNEQTQEPINEQVFFDKFEQFIKTLKQ
jgi:hypothetical protein